MVDHTQKPVRLIGVPTDVGAGVRGCSMGPQALRVANLAQALTRLGVSVEDVGDLHGPNNPWQGAVDGFRHFAEVLQWNQTLHDAFLQALNNGHMPIMLGGDHCLAMGSISAVARHCQAQNKKLRVLWFDAHADFNTADITPSGNIHGMPVACLCGHGHEDLVGIGGFSVDNPALAAQEVYQIGIRSVDAGEKRLVHQAGIEVFDMRYIDEHGMRATMTKALAGLDADTHLHVSLDLDFIDPSIAPGVGTRVRGGPNYREAQLCMEMVADSGLLASLDIVEVNPALDTQNQTAELAVDLVESLFGKSTLMRKG